MKADLETQIYLAGLPKPTREARFHPTRRWRWDLCWPEQKVAVEIQGGVWQSGRHTRGKGYTSDCEKLNEAQLLGWVVVWVTYDQIDSGQALNWIGRALAERGLPLLPDTTEKPPVDTGKRGVPGCRK